ncbi:MAG: hypothetical protein ACU0DI_02235 [Paracoccaceae bacterium]
MTIHWQIVGVVRDHWSGRLPLWLAIAGPLLGGHIGARMVLRLADDPDRVSQFALILALAGFVVWQITGSFRAIDKTIAAFGAMAQVAVAYIAMIFVLGSSLLLGIGLAVPPWAGPAKVAEPVSALVLSADRMALVLDGPITLLEFNALERETYKFDSIRTLQLTSVGGNIHAARGMARLTQSLGLTTVVYGRCYSACTLVFLAGSPRILRPGGDLGFHEYGAGSYEGMSGGIYQDAGSEQEKDRAYFRSRGVAEDFLQRMFDSDHGAIWLPSRDELVRAGIIAG